MSPTDEARFIALWTAGLDIATMTQRLGIPQGTVGSRARRLQQRGLIQPRPKGGAYPRQKALTREESGTGDGVSPQTPEVPPGTPRVPRGVSTRVSKPVPVEVLPSLPASSASPEMTPVLQEILQELRTLTQGLAGRVSDQAPQVSEGVSQGVSLGPREKTERWNLHLPKDLITHTKAKAQALGVHPSELVAELLRRGLAEEA